MSLSAKIGVILLAGSMVFLASVYVLSRYVILDAFLKINVDNAKTNNMRVEEAVTRQMEKLNSAAADWAPWDESYQYVLGLNPTYIENNVNSNTMENLGIDFMIFTDKDNNLLTTETLKGIGDSKLQQQLMDYITANLQVKVFSDVQDDVTGFVKVNETPIMISAHPITTNDYVGTVAGTLIFGKVIRDDFINSISETTKLPVSISRDTGTELEVFRDKILGRVMIKDIENQEAIQLVVESPKKTYNQGYDTVQFFTVALLSAGLIIVLLNMVLLRLTVILPIRKLTWATESMAKGNLHIEVPLDSQDELGSLARSFNSMGKQLAGSFEQLEKSKEGELEKANEIIKLKDEFVFIAAHELKAPVTIISGFIDIMKNYSQNISADLKEDIDALDKAADRLENLLFDLLEISRAESGTLKVRLSPIEINGLINQVVEGLTARIKEKNISLKQNFDTEASMVMADEIKLTEILNNLISNAIKYNKVNGLVEIKTTRQDTRLLVEVIDTGYGIPTDQQSKIFSKFFRVVIKETEDVEGTGLGLFVTRMLVEKMGGTIGFKSVQGNGSNFYFTLKLAE